MNFDITFDPRTGDDESPQDAWERRIDTSIIKLKADLTAHDVATEYPDVDDNTAAELCNRAAANALEHGDTNGVVLEDFPSIDELNVDDPSGTTTGENAADEGGPDVPFHKRRQQDDQAPSERTTADTGKDTEAASSPSSDAGSGTGRLVTTDEVAQAQQPSQMERDELEAEVATLRDRVDSMDEQLDQLQTVANRDVALLKGALRNLFGLEDGEDLDQIIHAATDYHTQREEQETRIDTLEREVSHLDSTVAADGGEKRDKVASIVRMASNRRSPHQDVVKMTASDIVDATGVSRRYAYDLLDDLPEEHDWVLEKPQAKQYGSVEIDDNTRAIGLDFAAVHSAGVPLNKFTTGGGE